MPKRSKKPRKPRPNYIWNTYGDWVGTLVDDHIWDLTGLRVAWVDPETREKDVWRADGEWIGNLSRDNRILRKRTARRRPLRDDIPQPPPKPELPVRATLPPSFAELQYSEIDVLEEDPQIFKKLSDMRPDMD